MLARRGEKRDDARTKMAEKRRTTARTRERDTRSSARLRPDWSRVMCVKSKSYHPLASDAGLRYVVHSRGGVSAVW